MKNKFMVGQKYKVRDCESQRNGNIIEITKISGDIIHCKILKGKQINKFNPNGYFADHLELIEPQKIVITSDGVTTTAKLYNAKKLVKTAQTKCNPADDYNFLTGAEIAVGRLKLLNTKIVITESSDNSYFTVGKIYEVKDGYFIPDCGEQYPSEEPIKDIDDLKEYFKGDEEMSGKRNGYFSDETIKFVEIVEE